MLFAAVALPLAIGAAGADAACQWTHRPGCRTSPAMRRRWACTHRRRRSGRRRRRRTCSPRRCRKHRRSRRSPGRRRHRSVPLPDGRTKPRCRRRRRATEGVRAQPESAPAARTARPAGRRFGRRSPALARQIAANGTHSCRGPDGAGGRIRTRGGVRQACPGGVHRPLPRFATPAAQEALRSARVTPVKGRREGGGGQNWGAHDDTRPSSTGIIRCRDRPGDGQGCEGHPPVHRPWPGAADLRAATAAGVPPRFVQGVSAGADCGLSAAERSAPSAGGSQPRLRRRLYRDHRLPAHRPSAGDAAVRGPLRDAAGPPGAGRLRPVSGGLRRRTGDDADRLAVLAGARLQPLAVGALRPASGACRRSCAATSRRSPTSAACRRRSSTTG